MDKKKSAAWTLLLLFWHLLDKLLSQLEHAEFIHNHLPWLKRAMSGIRDALTAPDWVGTYLIPFIGLGLIIAIFWSELRQKFSRQDGSSSHATALAPADATQAQEPMPDTPIAELFDRLGLTTENDNPAGYDAVVAGSRPILDALSTGQLKIWGRLKDQRTGELLPLVEIPPEYWQHSDFSYFFLIRDGTDKKMAHTDGDKLRNKPAYWDLQLSRQQIAGTWPESAAETQEREKRQTNSRALLKLDRTRKHAINRLSTLRSEGVVIRNSATQLTFTSDLDRWTGAVDGWLQETADVLKVVSSPDSEWFLTLDTVPPARVDIPNIRLGGSTDRESFVRVFRQHDYRLARLDGLLKKYGVGA